MCFLYHNYLPAPAVGAEVVPVTGCSCLMKTQLV